MLQPEAWYEPPYQVIYSIGDPTEGIIPLEAGFTPRQRAWYSRVYHGVCHFPKFTDDGQIYPCGSGEHLEVHHIVPDGWTRAQTPWIDPNETLGIVLCRAHHNGVLHPDIQEAIDNYKYDQDSFAKAIAKHREAASRGEVFWNDEWDEMLRAIAEGAIARYMTEHPSDVYPLDSSWAKKFHPKRPKWYDNLF